MFFERIMFERSVDLKGLIVVQPGATHICTIMNNMPLDIMWKILVIFFADKTQKTFVCSAVHLTNH